MIQDSAAATTRPRQDAGLGAAAPSPHAATLSPEAQQRNLEFFLHNIESYRAAVADLDTYDRLREAIDAELDGVGHLVDVGNGGVFDYDTSLPDHITAIDIFFDKLPRDAFERLFPRNCTPITGNALSLPAEDGHFDGGLMVMLLHHLVGKRVRDNARLLRQAIVELHRVIRPGGRLVIAESCVPAWFYYPEIAGYNLLAGAINMLGKHPATFQYTRPIVEATIRDVFGNARSTLIPKGRWILQFGVKVPSFLTPANQYVFTATKAG